MTKRAIKSPSASNSLFDRLEADLDTFTAAERGIANFILTNKETIPFETAVSVAARVGVSAVTVGRFCRTLGYGNFRDLKADLKAQIKSAPPWLEGDRLSAFVSSSGDHGQLHRSLKLELSAMADVYRQAETPEWDSVASRLAESERVYIAGFQTERGIAVTLAHLLHYVREHVQLVDVAAGNYAEIFASTAGDQCLVIVDIRRYSRQSYLLAERAARDGIALIIITDRYCDWARTFTGNVITVSTEGGLFWSSSVSLICAVNLLVNSVVGKLGAGVEKRLEQFSELHQHFTGYVGLADRRTKRRGR